MSRENQTEFFHIHLLHNHSDGIGPAHENSREIRDNNISIDSFDDVVAISIDLVGISDSLDKHHVWTNKQFVREVQTYFQTDFDD